MHMKKESPAPAPAPESDPPAADLMPEVAELVVSLERRSMYREVTLTLRSGLRDASADFSFLRVRGLRSLLKSLNSFSQSDDVVHLFRHSQSHPQLQVVPVLFENSLRQLKGDPVVKLDRIFGVEPMKISSPATDAEVALALRVLEGCCLLHKESVALAHQKKAVKVLLNILSTRGILELGLCLDALISLMLDSSANQMDFEACHGIERIAELIAEEQGDENIRKRHKKRRRERERERCFQVNYIQLKGELKCGEFLLLLIGHVNGRREGGPLATIYEDIKRFLGEKCASLIWAASQFGSTLDPHERQTALRIQARRVLESLELID